MQTKQLRTILIIWFLLLSYLASREGDWWEDKLAEYLEQPIKISLKPKPIMQDVIEFPHPSREMAQMPLVQEFDQYSTISGSISWRGPRPKKFMFDRNPFNFPPGINWVIEKVDGQQYLIVKLKYSDAEIATISQTKKGVILDWE